MMTRTAARIDLPVLKLHLEPSGPIEVAELTRSLGALASWFGSFVESNPLLGKGASAKLLVSNVSPGSIDLSLIPDFPTLYGLLAPAYDPIKFMIEFGSLIKETIKSFSGDAAQAVANQATVTDCQNVANFAAPIANHGGTQSVTVIVGDVYNQILNMDSKEASRLVAASNKTRQILLGTQPPERRKAVTLEWIQLNRDSGRTDGKTSPDRAIIADIDPKAHPVFFTDDTLFLKERMIGDDENPYQKIYFVDAEVSYNSEGKVTLYRVAAFHGKEDLP